MKSSDPETGKTIQLIQGLYLIATPIGNIGDMTLRAIETLKAVDVVACEDTRETGRLFSFYGISARKISYHEHNADRMRPKILEMIRAGKSVALVSDAGMPLISDPGYRLVQDCIAHDLPVTCLPGATAVTTALALSGLPTDRFLFAGFLPQKQGPRRAALTALAAVPATLVFYEGPSRLAASLADMCAVLGDRAGAVARELTKKFEEVRRAPLSELAAFYAENGPPRGEIVVMAAPPLAAETTDAADVDTALRKALQSMTVRDAAAQVATLTGCKKKDVYARALVLQGKEA